MARARRKSRQPAQAPGWVWMSFGLVLGLGVAVAVYLSGAGPGFAPRASSLAAASKKAPVRAPGGGAQSPTSSVRSPSSSASSPASSAASSAAPKDRGPYGTKFDFYEILPQSQVVVPEVETPTKSPPAPAPVATPGRYVLQAGSFRSHGEADHLQASLALLGIESRIQKVTIDDDEFHRVRIGPIDDLDTLNRIRDQLHDAGITPIVMRVDGD